MRSEKYLIAMYIRVYNKLKKLLDTNQTVAVVYNTPIDGIPGSKVRLGWYTSSHVLIKSTLGIDHYLYKCEYISDEHYIKDIIEKYMSLACNGSEDNLKIVFELESRI